MGLVLTTQRRLLHKLNLAQSLLLLLKKNAKQMLLYLKRVQIPENIMLTNLLDQTSSHLLLVLAETRQRDIAGLVLAYIIQIRVFR